MANFQFAMPFDLRGPSEVHAPRRGCSPPVSPPLRTSAASRLPPLPDFCHHDSEVIRLRRIADEGADILDDGIADRIGGGAA